MKPIVLSVLAASAFTYFATDPYHPPIRDIYVLAGQSNMDGRGKVGKLPSFTHLDHVWKWDADDTWERPGEPWNRNGLTYPVLNENKRPGASPITAFADRIAEQTKQAEIGVVGATRGGTNIQQWAQGTPLFDALVARSKKALASAEGSKIRGLLWYQGESDAKSAELAAAWPDRFRQLVRDYREAVGEPDLPVVMVVIGADPESPIFPAWKELQRLQRTMTLPDSVARVSAEDLPIVPGKPHLNTDGVVAIGRRMADAFGPLQTSSDHVTPPRQKIDDVAGLRTSDLIPARQN